MPFTPEIEPITESAEDLAALLSDPAADLPPLLPALAYALGDLSLLPNDLRPDPAKVLEEQAGWTAEQMQRCVQLALPALERLRAGESAAPPADEDLHRIMAWLCGVELSGSYVTMLEEELAPSNTDLRAPKWNKGDLDPHRPFTVAIVGAGMSGILMAHRLQQAGVDYVVLEKNPGIGGTWYENTYPGCRVDVSNHVYCYSFMQKHDWPQYHSSQDVLLEYFNNCADEWDIRQNVRFGVEVTAMTWDEDANVWAIETREMENLDGDPAGAAGSSEGVVFANAVVSAVGQLNQPRLPDIVGMEQFAGSAWHSARWNHDIDLAGKRVGVIGSGCSALQLIPKVAEVAAHTTVFQRTPNWLMPRPQYQQPLGDSLMWLFTHVPHYNNWFRLRLFWRSHEGLLPSCVVDPDWEDPGDHSVSAASQELGAMLRMYLHAVLADRPDLLDKITPQYPMGAKRVVVDDGSWPMTLKQDNVVLCTDPIERINAGGVQTLSGSESGSCSDASSRASSGDHGDGHVEQHDVDVLVYATGFKAADFLTPMKVVGRGGVDLHEHWDGDARAYLGVVHPGFPNFFFTYGPNTNIVINGSIIYFTECEVHYIHRYIEHLLANNLAAMDVKPDVHDRYNEWIDAGNLQMTWGVSTVNSWYKNATGRVAQNWPYSMLEFWEQTRSINSDDYEVLT